MEFFIRSKEILKQASKDILLPGLEEVNVPLLDSWKTKKYCIYFLKNFSVHLGYNNSELISSLVPSLRSATFFLLTVVWHSCSRGKKITQKEDKIFETPNNSTGLLCYTCWLHQLAFSYPFIFYFYSTLHCSLVQFKSHYSYPDSALIHPSLIDPFALTAIIYSSSPSWCFLCPHFLPSSQTKFGKI